ncbi:MAG: hypothetical protein IPG89_12180 [Bacteroidetes bacterium]|nr:hypothetical protein [Bacteroidota bacterium]
MKKLFLMLAFTGMVTAVSASTVSALTNTSIVSVIGDDKKGDDKGKKKNLAVKMKNLVAKKMSQEKNLAANLKKRKKKRKNNLTNFYRKPCSLKVNRVFCF